MSSHDGYSSDEEEDVPRQSQVYLGFTDTELDNEEDEATFEDSFIGGQPVWLDAGSKPDDELIKCKNCQGKLNLILQAFSPLDGALYDRVIYVFGCSKYTCNRKEGTIRAIRGIKKDPKKIAQLKKEEEDIKKQLDDKLKLDNSKNFLFGDQKEVSNPFSSGSDNPFSTDSSNPFGSNPFDKPAAVETKKEASFASIAAKNAPPPKPKNKTLPDEKLPEYPGYFIYVDQEKFQKKQTNKKSNIEIDESILDLETESSTGNPSLAPETQAIASTLQDKVFQHFSEIVSYNPLQVLRYDLGGKPLLFSSKDEVSKKIAKHLVPNPGYNPSSQRQFELQIMPKIIIDFERNDTDILHGIEWATIFIFTDVEDYIPKLDENHVGYVEEWVGVQWEESITKKVK